MYNAYYVCICTWLWQWLCSTVWYERKHSSMCFKDGLCFLVVCTVLYSVGPSGPIKHSTGQRYVQTKIGGISVNTWSFKHFLNIVELSTQGESILLYMYSKILSPCVLNSTIFRKCLKLQVFTEMPPIFVCTYLWPVECLMGPLGPTEYRTVQTTKKQSPSLKHMLLCLRSYHTVEHNHCHNHVHMHT